jgi:arginase family enzyme
MHVGGRALDPGEAEALERHGVPVLTPADAADEPTLARVLDDGLDDAGGVWLHIDLDVLDPDALALVGETLGAG